MRSTANQAPVGPGRLHKRDGYPVSSTYLPPPGKTIVLKGPCTCHMIQAQHSLYQTGALAYLQMLNWRCLMVDAQHGCMTRDHDGRGSLQIRTAVATAVQPQSQ